VFGLPLAIVVAVVVVFVSRGRDPAARASILRSTGFILMAA
jgi:hypothetical protein